VTTTPHPSTSSTGNNSALVIISVHTGGLFVRNYTNAYYVINTTMSVRIDGTRGKAVFHVLPKTGSVLHITHFNISCDKIQLTAFPELRSVKDLFRSTTYNNNNNNTARRRRLGETVNFTPILTIQLKNNQLFSF
jgi:hypothetical protein